MDAPRDPARPGAPVPGTPRPAAGRPGYPPGTPLPGVPRQRTPAAGGTPGRPPGPVGPVRRVPPVGPGGPRPVRGRVTRRQRPRRSLPYRVARAVLVVLCTLVLGAAGGYVWADGSLHREVDLGALADRPPGGAGTTYLVVGSDSRKGLDEATRRRLSIGSAGGGRTDSIILVHRGRHGTTMVSLPRDSWVTVPPYVRPETGRHYPATKNKINAAYALGGPDLLVRTVEHNTGVRVDHYVEVGFAGFVDLVDAVGGVRMCVNRDIRDKASGLDLTRGCHTLDGGQALAFVRQRHQEAKGDLGRTRNQQRFLGALAHRAATPDVLLDPRRSYRALRTGLDTLTVDTDMGLRDLADLFRAMREAAGERGRSLHVPVADLGFRTAKGSAVRWDRQRAEKLFAALRHDRPVDARHAGR